MKNAKNTVLATALFSALLAGCSASKSGEEEDKSRSKLKATLAYYEATLNPSDYDEELTSAAQTQANKQQGELVIPRDSVEVEEEVAQGFRIQIFASASIDEANTAKAIASQKFFADSVYVVYDSPVYKVRVGDFVSRLEANQKLQVLVDQGYPDAWVVPDRIVQRKIRRITSPLQKLE